MNNTLVSLVFQVIALINLLFIVFTVFIERKKPVSALAWILVLIFLPLAGFLLYLIFGINVRFFKRLSIKKEDKIKSQSNLPRGNTAKPEQAHDGLFSSVDYCDEVCKGILKMHYNLSGCEYTQDNDVAIFTNGQEKYEKLLKDIENAACSIDMLYFIFKNDRIGKRIVDLLVKKAREGAAVRVIYDKRGSLLTPYKMFKELIEAGGRVCRIYPLKFGSYFKLNYMNHRKIAIIDGKVGYVGGMNIGDEYMGHFRGNVIWRDTHLRITGSAVNSMQAIFNEDWVNAGGEKIESGSKAAKQAGEAYESENKSAEPENMAAKGNMDLGLYEVSDEFDLLPSQTGKIGMQIVSNGPDSSSEQIKWGLIKMIYSARSRVYIQTPYFIPDEAFLEALKTAAASGVDVQIMLPDIPDKKFVYNVTLSYLEDLFEYGIKVYMYPGFLHAKMAVMDDRIVSIGTTNIDIRSFGLDFEINAFIYDIGISQKCSDIFKNDAEISRLATREWYNSRGMTAKFRESLCRLFSPIL